MRINYTSFKGSRREWLGLKKSRDVVCFDITGLASLGAAAGHVGIESFII